MSRSRKMRNVRHKPTKKNPAGRTAGFAPDFGLQSEKASVMVANTQVRDRVAAPPSPLFFTPQEPSRGISFAPARPAAIITEGRQKIGPDLAERILKETNYSRQRGVKPFRLHRHLTTIERGQWYPDCTIRFALLNGALILVDGQHRLNAVIKSGAELDFIVVVTPVKTEAEVHTLYSRIDVDGNRSIADVLKAADPTNGFDISHEMRRNAYWAMEALANDFPHKKLKVGESELVTKEDRVVCLSFWLKEMAAFDQIVRAGQSNLRIRLRTPGIIAVALATIKHQPEKGLRFWTSVADNKLLKPGDPEQALVNFLLTAKLNDGYRVSERGAVQAWNAWFNGRRRESIKKDPSSERPIIIAGTPFQGHA